MQGGDNIESLIAPLDNATLTPLAVKALSHILLIFDAFYDVEYEAKTGNTFAQQVIHSWASVQ